MLCKQMSAVPAISLIRYSLILVLSVFRYRNQEFLLTDSVFRYDGYTQLDDF